MFRYHYTYAFNMYDNFYIYTDIDFCYVYMDIVDGILMILNSCKYYML